MLCIPWGYPVGGATDAFRNNVPLHLIDSQGRLKSGQTKYRYLHVSDAERIVAMKPVYQYNKWNEFYINDLLQK